MTNISANPPPSAADTSMRDGLIFGVLAYSIWGILPIYLKSVDHVSAMEILAHRILWSAVFGALLIALRSQWGEVKTAFMTPRVLLVLGVSAVAISCNWLIYVWAVINDHVLEASLGYYINPLMYVAVGVFLLGEKLRPLQIVSVAIAALGVAILTFGVGVFPWISLSLAILFTLYGYIRKTAPVGAMPGLFIETSLLSPIAAIFLVTIMSTGSAQFLNLSAKTDALLIFAGPATVLPLVMFALAARRMSLTMLGFLQYIGPTIQLILGIYYGEKFTGVHAISFGLIWFALAIFSFEAINNSRKQTRARLKAGA